MFLLTETAYSARNGAPTKTEEWFLRPLEPKERKMAQPVLNKAFLQPAKTVATCTACCDYVCHLPLSTLYASTRPKLHDEYTHHQWLKG